MPYPIVTQLADVPARATNTANFSNEATKFLDSLIPYRDDYNAFLAYINTNQINHLNFGNLEDENPNRPTTTVLSDVIGGEGLAYILSVEGFYNNLRNASFEYSLIGNWFDAVRGSQGVLPYVDPACPIIPLLPEPHTRFQAKAAFNTSAVNFTNAAKASLSGLSNAVTYLNTACFGNDDYGVVTDATITVTLDCGLLTESVTA